jgi:catechol 2,3-dioxygenase-like lactoylglutathione lyase family enzyme
MIGHVDLRVRDLEAAAVFYEALLPELGFVHRYHGGDWKVWASDAQVYVALTESQTHVANECRIAFRAEDAAQVDQAAAAARAAGAEVSGPKAMPYGPGYYAAYFADPSGNPLEVYVRP